MKRIKEIRKITFAITAIIAFAFILAPLLSNFAHNHEFDGQDHENCPVHFFTAAFHFDQAITPIYDCVITPLYILQSQEINSHKLLEYYSSLAQRAPPA